MLRRNHEPVGSGAKLRRSGDLQRFIGLKTAPGVNFTNIKFIACSEISMEVRATEDPRTKFLWGSGPPRDRACDTGRQNMTDPQTSGTAQLSATDTDYDRHDTTFAVIDRQFDTAVYLRHFLAIARPSVCRLSSVTLVRPT